jgi:hypothetical protein
MRRQLMVWCVCAGMVGALAMDEARAEDGEDAQPIQVESSGAKKEKKAKKVKKAKRAAREDEERPRYQRAQAAALEGRYDEAIALCDAALSQGEQRCHRVKAVSYEKLGDKPSACASYRLAAAVPSLNTPAIKEKMKKLQCL